MLLSVGQCCRASVWMASWVAEKVSDSSPILGTMLEKTSIEPHHVGSNRRALRMNGPASQDYGFSHPQLLHLFYLDSFIYQVSAAAPLLRPLGVAQPSSLVLYLGPSAAANNNICLQHQLSTVSLHSHLEQLLSARNLLQREYDMNGCSFFYLLSFGPISTPA